MVGELFRWCSTSPIVVLNDANRASEQWGSPAPQVVPPEANIHQEPTELNGGTNIVQHALEGNDAYVRARIHYSPTEYMVYRTRLAEVVSSERNIQGLSRMGLAERAGVTRAAVERLERAEPFETLGVVWPILRVLDIQPSAVPAPGFYQEHGLTPVRAAILAQGTGLLYPASPVIKPWPPRSGKAEE